MVAAVFCSTGLKAHTKRVDMHRRYVTLLNRLVLDPPAVDNKVAVAVSPRIHEEVRLIRSAVVCVVMVYCDLFRVRERSLSCIRYSFLLRLTPQVCEILSVGMPVFYGSPSDRLKILNDLVNSVLHDSEVARSGTNTAGSSARMRKQLLSR